jgi:hypothetical protein
MGHGGFLSVANLLLVIALALTTVPGYVRSCLRAASEMGPPASPLGLQLTERTLVQLLLIWLVMPLVAREMQASNRGVAPLRLVRFPFSLLELHAASIGGALVNPLLLLLFLASFFVLVPLSAGPRPLPGALAGVLFVMLALRGAQAFAGLFRPWTPPSLAVRAAAGGESWVGAGGLALWCLVTLGLSLRCLASLLKEPSVGTARRGGRRRPLHRIRGLPPPLGVTTRKELRYLSRSVDAVLGYGLGALGAVYLLISGTTTPAALVIVPVLIVLGEAAIPLNAFGLDGRGFDRYRLLPLSAREVLLSKNLAFLLLLLLQLSPLILVGALRFGPLLGAATLFGSLSYALASILIGNVVSSRSPVPREFLGMDALDQSGGLLPVISVMMIWGIPLGLALAAAPAGPTRIAAAQLALLFLLVAVYFVALPRAARRCDANADEMSEALRE